jgi:two-component system NarL family sensor kinase
MDGTNIVHPKLPHLVGMQLVGPAGPETGDLVIRNLIRQLKRGGGFHQYVWHKPSTGRWRKSSAYAILLDKWGWMLGTGLYTDDISKEVNAIRTEFAASVRQTVVVIFAITFGAIIVIAGTLIVAIRFSEQRFADSKLKELNNRIFDVQEQERKRVSTELHDSISQLLVSVRYGIEMIHTEAAANSVLRGAIKCLKTLDGAISEVRRISRDLRPSILDDMGLATALNSLGKEFQSQSGITVNVEAERSHDKLSDGAKTALYRVVQECMTNVARHSHADTVDIRLSIGPQTLLLTVEDNGIGIPNPPPKTRGLGIRNMHERIETHGGTLNLSRRTGGGTLITVTMPLNTQIKKAA